MRAPRPKSHRLHLRRGAHPFGAVIREMRTRRGWTQQQLADAADVNPVTASVTELGKCDPKIGTVRRMLRALGYDLHVVIATDGAP